MLELLIFIGLLCLGYFAGSSAEKRHYKSIKKREKSLLKLPCVTSKSFIYEEDKILYARLVTGSAVISVDYFKRLLAAFRNILGGRVKSYESLLDRARREAILRMKEKALDSAVILNMRLETTTIGRGARRGSNVGCVEAYTYGTAITLKEQNEVHS